MDKRERVIEMAIRWRSARLEDDHYLGFWSNLTTAEEDLIKATGEYLTSIDKEVPHKSV